MAKYTNRSNLPISLAVFLAFRDYDGSSASNVISATGLLKSVRQIVLGARLPANRTPTDIMALVPSSVGTAVHARIEHAWLNHHRECMQALGIPDHVIDRVKINPDPATVQPEDIPVYLELRSDKAIEDFIISGKFDFVFDGELEDFKNTSVFAFQNRSNDQKFMLQGSIYRWLNPHLITKDKTAIRYILSDWKAAMVQTDPTYPKERIVTREFQLLPLPATEQYIRAKLQQIKTHMLTPEPALPECDDDHLMRRAPVFKYYKNPEKRARSTKNFDTAKEAQQRYVEDGCIGVVVEVPGQLVGCKFCDCFEICTQKDRYIADGTLQL